MMAGWMPARRQARLHAAIICRILRPLDAGHDELRAARCHPAHFLPFFYHSIDRAADIGHEVAGVVADGSEREGVLHRTHTHTHTQSARLSKTRRASNSEARWYLQDFSDTPITIDTNRTNQVSKARVDRIKLRREAPPRCRLHPFAATLIVAGAHLILLTIFLAEHSLLHADDPDRQFVAQKREAIHHCLNPLVPGAIRRKFDRFAQITQILEARSEVIARHRVSSCPCATRVSLPRSPIDPRLTTQHATGLILRVRLAGEQRTSH